MAMTALVTGAKGFTGRHLVKLLRSQKIVVAPFNADLTNKQSVFTVISRVKPDRIFHLASPVLRSDRLIDDNLVKNLEVDLFGTVYLLEAASVLPNKPKILITNTAAVYSASTNPLTESAPVKPLTGYGLSKLTQELVSQKLCQSYGLPLIMTRTFLLVGPGQKPGYVVTDLARAIASGTKSISLGNPDIRRDFTDVRDACRAYYLLMTKGKPDEVYNVCLGKAVSIGTVAKKLIALSGRKIAIKKKPSWRRHDPPVVYGNNAKLHALGWSPEISFDQSLQDTLNYWTKIRSADLA